MVNKSDRPDAGRLATSLENITRGEKTVNERLVPVIKTVATTGEGVDELLAAIRNHATENDTPVKRSRQFATRAWQLIMYRRMKSLDKNLLTYKIMQVMERENFNLYRFVAAYQ